MVKVSLRDHADVIRKYVKFISEDDHIWNFSVESITDDKALIHWSYLNGEKNDSFIIQVRSVEYEDYVFITSRTPDDRMIYGYEANDDAEDYMTYSVEHAIRLAVHSIADYAHAYY